MTTLPRQPSATQALKAEAPLLQVREVLTCTCEHTREHRCIDEDKKGKKSPYKTMSVRLVAFLLSGPYKGF